MTTRIVLLMCALAVGAASAFAEPAPIDAAIHIDKTLADCGIQRAIDEAAAAPGGGVVTLPEGTFELRSGLVLKSKVQLVGAGMDKTILMPARRVQRLDVVKQCPTKDDDTIYLKEIPEGLDVGSAVMCAGRYPPSWYGSPRPAYVTAVDREAKTVKLTGPYGLNTMKPGVGYLTFGVSAALEKSIAKGDTEIVLKNASLLKAGDEIAIGQPDNESMKAHAFVKEVKGNTLVLESPTEIDFEAWPEQKKIGNLKYAALIWLVFPAVHGRNVHDAAVRDLTIQGHGFETVRPMITRYTLSGIHIFNGKNIAYERVAVRDWPSDGFSLQTGTTCTVIDCEATGNVGNGFHPGTGLTHTLFERCLAKNNGTGLYFCWHNGFHVMRDCKFIENRGGGITGLGNPGDRNNTIEKCEISRNGGVGIDINGGVISNNVIRDNVIENNSRAAPGKHPGILLGAQVEDARAYTITGNTIRDTQEKPTQFVGIEEKGGKRGKKTTYADENVIKGNTFAGHKTADIIVVGPKTVVEDNGEAKVVRNIEEPKPEPEAK